MKPFIRVVYRGAVEGAKAGFLVAVPSAWLHPLVLLDAAVTRRRHPSWWQRLAHRAVPQSVFDGALLLLISREPVSSSPRSRSSYGVVGSGKTAGVVCIDDKLGKVCGDVYLPRMVRTRDGREVLQQKLIKEQEAASAGKTSA